MINLATCIGNVQALEQTKFEQVNVLLLHCNAISVHSFA